MSPSRLKYYDYVEDWNFYLCNVNDMLASVFVDLGLRTRVPDKSRPYLLWVLINLRWPREDGLSASIEFDSLKTIEEKLTATLNLGFDALLCGRITTDARRGFYYCAPAMSDWKMRFETQ